MSEKPSVILMEFNELSPSLMLEFMRAGKLPNFQRLHNESHVYVTDAQESAPYLEPWIQWVTVHSGLPFAEHKVFHLGDGHKLREKCVWDVLSDAGFRVWVCGSMNVRYDLPLNGYVLPDPWTTGAAPYPDTLLSYFAFVKAHVTEHTNERVPLGKTEYLKFLRFMGSHGLSISTVQSAVRQLVSERDGKNRWKRATILDKLQFDLFRSVYRKLQPHFSTFFSNSTAHFQHMYWRNMRPELFKQKPTVEEQAEFDMAVLFGYQEMDKLVGNFLKLADEHTTLIFCTALSQQPCLIYEEQGGKVFYRPRDFEKLFTVAGISGPHTISPVMSEQFHIYFENAQDASQAVRQLSALQVDGRPVIGVELNGKAVFAGCCIFEQLPQDQVLHAGDADQSAPFFEVFYRVEGLKSGMHHPDGMLWVREPDHAHHLHNEKVPLAAIGGSILDRFSVPRPNSMRSGPFECCRN